MSYWVAHTDVPLAATYARGISMLHHSCSCRKDSVPGAAFWSAVFDNNVEGPTCTEPATQLDHVDFRKPDERDQTESAVERSTHYANFDFHITAWKRRASRKGSKSDRPSGIPHTHCGMSRCASTSNAANQRNLGIATGNMERWGLLTAHHDAITERNYMCAIAFITRNPNYTGICRHKWPRYSQGLNAWRRGT